MTARLVIVVVGIAACVASFAAVRDHFSRAPGRTEAAERILSRDMQRELFFEVSLQITDLRSRQREAFAARN